MSVLIVMDYFFQMPEKCFRFRKLQMYMSRKKKFYRVTGCTYSKIISRTASTDEIDFKVDGS